MYQFLYCFDQNYVKQAFTSIISILENVDRNIKFDIITNLSEDGIQIPKKINDHNYLESISFHKINMSNVELYNLSEAHVTEATFYRLFLQDYIKDESFSSSVQEKQKADLSDDRQVAATMPAKILELMVKVGDKVTKGETLLVTEAMKMEYAVTAKRDGTVRSISISVGDLVEDGDLLIQLE